LLRGIGVPKNEPEAKSFFSYAVNMKGGEACYNLAIMYLHGVGVKRDYRKVFSLMHDSATGGCIEAQLYLGIAHTLGSLFEPDVICISKIPFHTPIYRTEGLLLEGDIPYDEDDEELRFAAVRQDARAAFEWFRIAAKHDATYVNELSLKSKYLYARCYVDGLGTDFDRDKSVRLMFAAEKSGSKEATAYILENGLTRDMIENKSHKALGAAKRKSKW